MMKPKEIFIAYPKTAEQVKALKEFMQVNQINFDVSEKTYHPDFVSKINESREQYRKGEYISLEKKDIKSFLGLE